MYIAENAEKESEALEKYEEVLVLEKEHSINENTFKCLEKIIILAGRLGDFEKSLKHNTDLLAMTENWGRNDVNEAIQNIIKFANSLKDPSQQAAILDQTLGYLKGENKNLWLSSCIDLGGILLESGSFEKLD